MKTLLLLSLMLMGTSAFAQQVISNEKVFRYFDKVLFYDVYAGTVSAEEHPVPEGMLRLNNSRYARPIPASDLAQMGDTIRLDVFLAPSCDNYDRIANVSLVLLPKGTTHYNDADAGYLGRLGSCDPNIRRIEIGRFITPFMDKNKEVQEVPYTWDVSFLAPIMHDQQLLATTDLWIELTIEGVPYAANTQIAGCADRNDVFYGSAQLVTRGSYTGASDNRCMVQPVAYQRYVNNYEAGHSDETGTTTVQYTFQVEEDLEDALMVFVNSNHGANSGGEEYVRRLHYVFVNEWMAMVYRPGRTSCEPFRKYNTQGNGIYGSSVMSDASWQSFSNWCPGDKIDNRIIQMGAIKAGEYTFRMMVPDAIFNGHEGYFPFSLTFFGNKKGKFTGLETLENTPNGSLRLLWEDNNVTLEGENLNQVKNWQLLDMQGHTLLKQPGNNIRINMGQRPVGVYLLVVEMTDDGFETYKFFKK